MAISEDGGNKDGYGLLRGEVGGVDCSSATEGFDERLCLGIGSVSLCWTSTNHVEAQGAERLLAPAVYLRLLRLELWPSLVRSLWFPL